MRVHIVIDSVLKNTIAIDSIEAAERLFPGAIALDADIHKGKKGDTWDGAQFSSPSTDPVALKAALMSQILQLEGAPNYLNRGARELQLRLMEKEAQELAVAQSTAENPVTAEMVLAGVPYYPKLKALDDQIKELRIQHGAL